MCLALHVLVTLSYLIISYHNLLHTTINILSCYFVKGDIPTLTRTGAAPENDFHEIEVIQTQVNGHVNDAWNDLALGQHGQNGHYNHGRLDGELEALLGADKNTDFALKKCSATSNAVIHIIH